MKDQNLPRRFFILEPGAGKAIPWKPKQEMQTHRSKLADHITQYRNSLKESKKHD